MSVKDFPKPEEGVKAVFSATPSMALKVVGSMALTTMGMYYLAQGKKHADLEKMILVAALALTGVFLFL